MGQDLRYGWRQMMRNPGFTAAVIVTLALSIGANTAIFSFVDSTLLKPLPYADADRIVQVLVNLLSNAVKFSPSGGVVTIGVGLRENWVEFRVTDRGRGVPAAHHGMIFERFRQVETSDAREKGGAGLGLAICKSIIEQHGGTIGVESQSGKGSTFTLRLPAAQR